jgi:AcrR family transcriptional regulator
MVRGEALRHHILLKAKDVFLELGFNGASMDAIAERAGTTKRTLYAHFENKEQLFLAVIDQVSNLLRQKLKAPSDYGADPIEALVSFCGRFQKILVWGPAVRLCRLFTAEAEHFPEGAALAYEAVFGAVQERMEEFMRKRFGQSRKAAARTAEQLMSRVFHPRVIRALFGIDPISEEWVDEDVVDPTFDPAPIREVIDQISAPPSGPPLDRTARS